MHFSSNFFHAHKSSPRPIPTQTPGEDINVKYIAKPENMGSNIPFSELRNQEALIPCLANIEDSASLSPSTPPPPPQRTASRAYRSQSNSQQHPGHLPGYVCCLAQIDGLDDNETDRLHPALAACVDVARALTIMVIAVFKGLLTICHGITETLWHIPLLYEDPSVRDRDIITGFVTGCMSGARVGTPLL